ncbi:hypothetical protein [Neisseria lactamica]|uniref:hypothetical protein n=1 Tax=Neisseria lactamica TaxID=486 RepID=UPI001EFEE930|nr:hypothetical protein [Neisseria lactamica]
MPSEGLSDGVFQVVFRSGSRNPHCGREKALSEQYRQSIRGGATLPEALKRTENAAARRKLAELRRMLGGKGD